MSNKKITGTMISRYIDDGGSGQFSRTKIIGFCQEPKLEVLSKIIKTHMIYSYGTCFGRPIDKYPANMDGLIITDICMSNYIGMELTGTLDMLLQFDDMKRMQWDKFTLVDFSFQISRMDKNNPNINDFKIVYNDITNKL